MMKAWRLVARELARHPGALVGGTLALLVTVAASLVLPLLVGRDLFDRVLVGRDMAQLHRVLLLTLVLFIGRGLFQYAATYLLAWVAQRAVADLRARLHNHLQRLSIIYHQRHRVGDMVSRITSDITLVQTALTPGLSDLIQQLALLVGGAGIAVWMHWKLALVAFLVMPLVGVAVEAYGRVIRRYSKEAQEQVADVAGILQESLHAIRVVKAFTLEERQRQRFAASNERGFYAAMKSVQMMATAFPVVELLTTLAMAAVVYFGAREVLAGRLSAGSLVAFLSYLGMLSAPVASIGRTYTQMQQGAAAAERMTEIFREPVEAAQSPGTFVLVPEKVRGAVRFADVTFAYPDSDVEALHHINLSVEPGEVVALVGPSGAGKTTLVSLIPRFFDPVSGRIELDGRDLRTIRLASLRQVVAVVPQETVLFGLTVAENIAVGRPGASHAAIEQAARLANAHEFIMALPQGYDTVLGELGSGLSGGERQRLAIARAMLRQPRVLVLDEATSSLDAQSEALVQEALARLMEGRTTFIVAHRLSTVRRAHRIVVMEAGRIREVGAHEELLALSGLYARLYALQVATSAEQTPASAGGVA